MFQRLRFSQSQSILLGDKLINFLQAERLFPTIVTGKQSPCCYLDLLLYCFLLFLFHPPASAGGVGGVVWCKQTPGWQI